MLSLNDLSYSYDEQTSILQEINLTVQQGEIVCLLGQSGSGKTTLLRLIAGLERGYTGTILLNNQTLLDTPPHQRDMGLMFQDFALFPHMNVHKNVAFGLKMQGLSQQEQRKQTDYFLNLVGLGEFGIRDVSQLSGGEKQRVALARALAPQPKLLLLDEPLGSLDVGLRERLMLELRQIIKDIGLTALYVTHDQQEAYAVADRIAVIHRGRIEQIATPEKLFHHPKTMFVAEFLGFHNFISDEMASNMFGLPSKRGIWLVHPNAIALDESGKFEAQIKACVFQGRDYKLVASLDMDVEFTFTVSSQRDAIPQIGEYTQLRIDVQHIIHLQGLGCA